MPPLRGCGARSGEKRGGSGDCVGGTTYPKSARYAMEAYLRRFRVGGSSNGRTPDSDSGCLGSNPSPPATQSRLSRKFSLTALKSPQIAGFLNPFGTRDGSKFGSLWNLP